MELRPMMIVMAFLLSMTAVESQGGPSFSPDGQQVLDVRKLHPIPSHYWTLDLIMDDGSINHFLFNTDKECEASIPKFEKEQHGYNGTCTEHHETPNPPGPAKAETRK
jgi:hypothetical protein